MAKRKKKQTVREKNIRRIERYIRQKEKQGFRWTKAYKESIRQMTTPALKKLKPEFLLRRATALSPKTGDIVSGTKAQSERLSMARKAKKQPTGRLYRQPMPIYEDAIVLDRLYSFADSVPGVGGQVLRSLLNHEIATYGRDNVAKSLSSAPEEAIATATDLIYYENREGMLRAYNAMQNLIRGSIPTAEEAKETGEILDTLTDMSE